VMLSYDPKRLYYKKFTLFTRSVALIKLRGNAKRNRKISIIAQIRIQD
jgi:hypothetical protein